MVWILSNSENQKYILYKMHQVVFIPESESADLHRLRLGYREKIIEDGVFETYYSFDELRCEIEYV